VLPIRVVGRTLVLATEGGVDPVSASTLARKLDRPIACVIVPRGQVTVGLRRWHGRGEGNPRQAIDAAARAGALSEAKAEALWQQYVSRQVLFAEVLMSLGHLDPAALRGVLLSPERGTQRLGAYMVGIGLLSQAALDEALEIQKKLQGSLEALLEREGAMEMVRK
jgi:adsorption protein B